MACPAIKYLMNSSDFYEKNTQDKIVGLIQIVSRQSRSESDFNTYMIPILEWMKPRLDTDDAKSADLMSTIVTNIVYSVFNFIGGGDFESHKRLVVSME